MFILKWVSVVLSLTLLIGCAGGFQQSSVDEKIAYEAIDSFQCNTPVDSSERLEEGLAKFVFYDWIPLVRQTIMKSWVKPSNSEKFESAKIRIEINSDGQVVDIHFLRENVSPAFNRSVVTAIERSSPLPIPSDPDCFRFFKNIVFNFGVEV